MQLVKKLDYKERIMTEIKFIPTGNIFLLPDDEAKRIFLEDRGNYEIISGKAYEQKKSEISQTVKELVVVDNEKELLIEKAKSLGVGGNLKSMKIDTIKEKIAQKEAENK